MKHSTKVTLLVVLILIIDQALKVWVKLNFHLEEEIYLFGWDKARLHFIENNGMAFGKELSDGWWGKLALSLFRIIAISFLIYYMRVLIKEKVNWGLLASFGLILAGAIGNSLDSAFYGMLFSESPYHGDIATFMPEAGGYADFLFGKVVDMFYFPLFTGNFPEWFPFWAGERYTFFSAIFNVADIAITVGVFNLLAFNKSFFTTPVQGAQAQTDASIAEGIAVIDAIEALDEEE